MWRHIGALLGAVSITGWSAVAEQTGRAERAVVDTQDPADRERHAGVGRVRRRLQVTTERHPAGGDLACARTREYGRGHAGYVGRTR